MEWQDSDATVLRGALEQALKYLQRLPEAPVGATATLPALRARLCLPLASQGRDPSDVIAELVAGVEGGLHASAGGRFFGWVIGGSAPAALAADWLTSTWDQNAGMYAVAPAAAVVEEACGRWLLELLGLPAAASFALVTGCQMAHVTCLAAARNALLAAHGWDVEQHGLFAAPPIRILTGDQRHGTIERALRLLGLGRGCVTDLAVDARGQLSELTLREALAAAPGMPTVVLLQAGDLNTGSFDDFQSLIPIAKAAGAWVHVDGAFGLWAAASERYRYLVRGVEQADSWATDGHKWLNVPYDCGYAIVNDAVAHRRAFGHRATYLEHSTSARDPVDYTPEYSRRARGFATYAAIRSLGRDGIARLVDGACAHAAAIVAGAGAIPGVEVVAAPIINQGLLRFTDTRPAATEADHDAWTEQVCARINASGQAFFSCTTYRGRRCMRVSVSSCRTTEADVERTVRAIAAAVG